MDRMQLARESFQKKDKAILLKSHSEKAIQETIKNHGEDHPLSFNLPEIILGGQDGLVNVLGIILGMAAATSESRIVVVAGLAATFAESISMAAVALTSKLAQADYYQSEYERESWEIETNPEGEKEEIRQIYKSYGFKEETLEKIVETITSNKTLWLKVMMEQELNLEPVDRKEAVPAGVIVGISALVGSFIPLTPFFFLPIKTAGFISVGISTISLFLVGFYKAKTTIRRNFIRQGFEMAIIGMVSAFIGFLIGSLFKIQPLG